MPLATRSQGSVISEAMTRATNTGMSTMRTTVSTLAAFRTGVFLSRTVPTLISGYDCGEHCHRLCNQIDTFRAKHLGANQITRPQRRAVKAALERCRPIDLRRLMRCPALDDAVGNA